MTVPARDPEFTSETEGLNLIPIASMAGGWVGPLMMFWLYVWGPLRPFDYPAGDLSPPFPAFVAAFGLCLALWWLPSWYDRVYAFERSGRMYEALGVRSFRHLVPDGDLANRWRRRHQPSFRIIRSRHHAAAFRRRTQMSERGHLVLLMMGFLSAAFALKIGWRGWAVYLGLGNVVVNLYPVLLQRYTRSRLQRVLTHLRGQSTQDAEQRLG